MPILKSYKGLLLIIGIVLIYLMHIPFDGSYQMADIYLLYDYANAEHFKIALGLDVKNGRYVANILKESGMYLVSLVFVFLLWYETRKKLYLILLIWWTFNVLGYLLAYGQSTSLIGLPILFILLFIHYAKARKNN